MVVALKISLKGRLMSQAPQTIDVARFDPNMRAADAGGAELKWLSPLDEQTPLALSGFAWFGSDRLYRRLPKTSRHKLPEAVDNLANCTAGGQLRFQTDSSRLSIRARLAAPANLVHMPATGQCGFDCYAGAPGAQRYVNTTKYDVKQAEYSVELFNLPSRELRNITLYFPLYQGVLEVAVGVEPGVQVLPPPPFRLPRPVVIYGTSITQGGCASRPGMAFTNILSRRLNVDFVNLGFSGSGKGEPEVARTIAEIANPAALALDYHANAIDLKTMSATLPEFIRILRAEHPRTPLLVISRPPNLGEYFNPATRLERETRRDMQRDTVAGLRAAGDSRIWFQDMSVLLGGDYDEGTVDGTHPTDLGFLRMADVLEPVVKTILGLG
jgi:lysophospholipase L1-like esterase